MSIPPRPASSRRRLIVLALLLVAVVVSAIFFGPHVTYLVKKALRPPDTVIVPRETSVMFSLDLERLRGTLMWNELLQFFMKSSTDADAAFKNLEKGTGFNPLEDVDTVVGAYPRLDVGSLAEFGLVMHGKPIKPDRLEAWSRGKLKEDNKELLSRDYNGHKLLWDSAKPSLVATFDGDGTVLLGGDKWIEQMIDLESRPAKAPPDAVVPLLAKVKRDWVFWGAGPIPEFVRAKIRADGNFPTAASMTAAYLSVDFEGGVKVAGGAVLGSTNDAIALVTQLRALQDALKGSEQAQAAGLVRYIEDIKLDSQGAEVTLDINLSQERVDDLVQRAKAFLNKPHAPLPTELPLQSAAPPQLPSLTPRPNPVQGGTGSSPP